MKYPQCATAVPLPSRFDTMLVPASARAPAQDLRRAASGGLCGYNGFGLASRAPNMLVLPQKQAHVPLPVTERLTSAREARGAGHGGAGSSRGGAGKAEVCYAAGRLAVLADADSHAQRAFEGHTQLVTCMAMHPNGMQVASAQQGSGTHGTVAYASIWDVATLRELTRVGWSHAADGGAGTGGRMTACFERSICALAFSPDGALLLAVGTSSGDQHMLCAFETASGKLVARSVVMIARPVGVFGLLVGKALPHRMTKAQAAQHAKALADEAANSGRAAARQGGDGARAAADAAKKRAEAAAEAAQRTTATAADNAALLVVAVGAAPAPKFSLLAPEAGGGWALRPWKLGLYGGGGGGGGAPPPPAPRACTSALFGGAGFPSPLGSPCGLTLCGTGDGRVFFFDLVASAAALGSVDAHQGSAVSALCLVGSAGFASGGLDGKVHLWERRDAPPPAAARDPNAPLSAGQAAAPKLVRVHTYATRQKLKEPRPAGGGGGGRRRESGGGGSDSDSDAEDRDAQPATSAAAAATALPSGGRGRGAPGRGRGGAGRGAAAGGRAGGRGSSSEAAGGGVEGSSRASAAVPLPAAGYPLPALPLRPCPGAIRSLALLSSRPPARPSSAPPLQQPGRGSLLSMHGRDAVAGARLEQMGARVEAEHSLRRLGRQPANTPSFADNELARGMAAVNAAPTSGAAAIPTLVVGTARGSLWLAGPAGAEEVTGGHYDQPTCVAPHPLDAQSWASCGRDGQLLLWTAPHAAPRIRARLPTGANCVAFSEDGRYVATGHADGTVRVMKTPLLPWRPPDAHGRRGVRLELVAVSGAPAELSSDRAAPVGLRPTGVASASEITCLVFSANGASSALLAAGSHDKTIRILELKFGAGAEQAAGGGSAAAASRAGGATAGGGHSAGRGHDSCAARPLELSDGSIRPPREAAWDVAHGLGGRLVPRGCCRGHTHTVLQLDFSADGAVLMSNCAGREVILWQMPEGRRLGSTGRLATETPWLNETCLLGFDRMGIWGQLSNGTPIATLNSCHVVSAAGNGGFGGTLGGSAGGRDGGGGSGASERERSSIERARAGLGSAPGPGSARAAAAAATAPTYDRSGLVLTAGDYGDVRLLRSPSIAASAPAREGHAHCERVACARFLNEGIHAVSAGRYDALIVRWEVREDGNHSVCCSGVATTFPGR